MPLDTAPIEPINPLEYPEWDKLLLDTPGTTFFHTAVWAKVLNASYGYRPLYFALIKDKKLAGLTAVMEVDSFVKGRRGVSLPFTDYCPSICAEQSIAGRLRNTVAEYGRAANWRRIELRENETSRISAQPSSTFITHRLDLSRGEEETAATFRPSNIRNIKRAAASGLVVKRDNSLQAMADFYRLHCMTRRRHGLPPQPWKFFINIQRHILSKQYGIILLAEFEGKCIAGAVYFQFNKEVIYKFGASDSRMLHLRPNNLIMWKAIQWYCRNGWQSMNLGRTEAGNHGLRQFKRGWGAREENLQYYTYDIKKRQFDRCGSSFKSSYTIFRGMPIPILRLAGRILYRHVA